MIALAYLFVLQGLLAPSASLIASARAAVGLAAMPLCDDPSVTQPQGGGPGPQHDHGSCCDPGCLPQGTGFLALAIPAGTTVALPVRPVTPIRRALLSEALLSPSRPPGLPGARAPPGSIA
jgi:hypothetical protein